MQLRPTQLLIFGNANLGTPLMQEDRRIGNDLPLKVLAYESADGTVFLVYNDNNFLKERYSLTQSDGVFAAIGRALESFTSGAVRP